MPPPSEGSGEPVELPTGYIVRHPRERDSGTIAEVVVAGDIADFGEPDFTEDDLIDDRVPEHLRNRRDAMFQHFDPYALRELGWQLFGGTAPSMRPRLGEIACPVTVLVGANDHPLVDQAPELAAEVVAGDSDPYAAADLLLHSLGQADSPPG